jgi:hypothetical protein
MSTLEQTIIPIPGITDFHVIQDKSFEIQIGGNLGAEKAFTLQPFPTGESLWLVAWNVCTESGRTATYEVRINGQLAAIQSVRSRDWHLVQEALGSALVPAGPNRIQFRALSRRIRLSLGDMTLFFRDALAIS